MKVALYGWEPLHLYVAQNHHACSPVDVRVQHLDAEASCVLQAPAQVVANLLPR